MTKPRIDTITLERIRAEFVAKEIEASGYSDWSGCDTCGGPIGKAFRLEDIHKILDSLLRLI